jgi:hypothetical protein
VNGRNKVEVEVEEDVRFCCISLPGMAESPAGPGMMAIAKSNPEVISMTF